MFLYIGGYLARHLLLALNERYVKSKDLFFDEGISLIC
jgi:hypothetical protein